MVWLRRAAIPQPPTRRYLVSRFGLVLALLCTTALALSGAALASPATKTPAPSPEFFQVSGSCAFDILVHTTAQNESQITFSDGSFLVTGKLKADLSNAVTGKTISLNIPGPGRYVPGADGTLTLTVEGPWFLFFPGQALFVHGLGTLVIGPGGSFSFSQRGGTVQDLCAALS
jgi:hypothetical protein